MFTAIIQARKYSQRYPEKMLKAKIHGELLLDSIIFRLQSASAIDKIVLAVPYGETEFQYFADKWHITMSYGDEKDVLSRFVNATREQNLQPTDWVLRVCGDAPYPSPLYINHLSYMIKKEGQFNYDAAFIHELPKGQWVQAFTASCLERASAYAKELHDDITQEHIDPLLDYQDFENRRRMFRLLPVATPNLYVDTIDDERRLNAET